MRVHSGNLKWQPLLPLLHALHRLESDYQITFFVHYNPEFVCAYIPGGRIIQQERTGRRAEYKKAYDKAMAELNKALNKLLSGAANTKTVEEAIELLKKAKLQQDQEARTSFSQ